MARKTTTSITIPLSKHEKERLEGLALAYGFSLPEFSKRVLDLLTSNIPTERLDEYTEPAEVARSLRNAFKDYRAGKVSTVL